MDIGECKNGNHVLTDILKTGNIEYEQIVVRWCPECGAIVVDLDYDGRTYPGHQMKMKYPELAKKKLG